LIIVRNAPGDSRWNAIERLWSFLNNKLAGLTLPTKIAEETDDEYEDRCLEILNAALQDFVYDGHEVKSIAVPCGAEEVEVDGSKFANNFFKEEEAKTVHSIQKDKKMNRRTLRRLHPDIADNFQVIMKHVQITLHGFVFRKCKPGDGNPCGYCKANPTRGSKELWSVLPSKKSGGLFYDCEPDPNKPGHYRTLLDLVSNVNNIKIKPDGEFADVERCKEKNCLVSFKSKADANRHYRLFHDLESSANPNGYKCNFKMSNGEICATVYQTQWLLVKHKQATGHSIKRKKSGDNG